MINFEIGDVVRLKKDYIYLTVMCVDNDWVEVIWFGPNDNRLTRKFRPEELILVERG